MSSTKAEYQGVAVITCEAISLKRLLKDLQVEVSDQKKAKADPEKSPKADMRAVTEGKSRCQSGMGETKPTRERKTRPRHGLKTKDELETTNSDESGNGSETTNLVHMLDSETLNQPNAMWRKGQQKCVNREAVG